MLLLGLVCILPLTAEDFRILTNEAGKKIKAELLSKSDGKITFRMRNSMKKYTVDIAALSAADQEFLEDWVPEGQEEKINGDEESEGGDGEEEDMTSTGSKSLYPRTKQEIKAEIKEILKFKSADKKSSEEQKATNLLNVYRYVCGVPAKVKMDKKLNGYCEEAAQICEENGTLSHDFGHYTDKSNLTTVGDVVDSVRRYMDDSGANNREKRGHRRWCLNPPMKKTGFGSGKSGYSAMWAMDGSHDGSRVKTWSYPGEGYFPKDYMHGTGWSFYQQGQVPPKNKIKISIFKLHKTPTKKISSNAIPEGRDIGVRYIATYKNTINFEPKDFTAGDRGIYWVRITGGGMRVGYVVEFF